MFAITNDITGQLVAMRASVAECEEYIEDMEYGFFKTGLVCPPVLTVSDGEGRGVDIS